MSDKGRRRRRFGKVRHLVSGRWQASYLAPDGRRRFAPSTFPTKTDAGRWLVTIEAQLLAGNWHDPLLGRETLGTFADAWIEERAGLRPKTIDLYRWLNGRYLQPTLGRLPVNTVSAARVRAWRAGLLKGGASQSTVAKAYRLLHAILNTAVADGLIRNNPCQIPGAGLERPDERPVLTIQQVLNLAALMPRRLRPMVLLATFAGLRYGEVTALTRADIHLEARVVHVRAQYVERSNGSMELGPPKSAAGIRTLGLPDRVVEALVDHLNKYVGPMPDALLFTGTTGKPLRRTGFNRAVKWKEAVTSVGVPQLHFHDLRHTGNTLAAGTPGTSTRDLMDRLGHSSSRAAMIYQHKTKEADRRIADSLDDQMKAAENEPPANPNEGETTGNHGDTAPGSNGTNVEKSGPSQGDE
jgi:integrase